MASVTRKSPGYMRFKGIAEFKVGNGFIWKKVRAEKIAVLTEDLEELHSDKNCF